jgi:hypothetical protein
VSTLDVELAHEGGESQTPHGRRVAALVGVAALAASLLGVLQVHSSTAEGRAHTRATRISSEITRGLSVQGSLFAFAGPMVQDAIRIGLEANSRALAALARGAENAGAYTAMADADNAAVERLTAIANAMAAPPGPESGVDALTREEIARDLREIAGMTREQNRQVDLAETFGKRGDRSTLALSVLAVAAVLLGLGGIVGPGRAGSTVVIAAAIAIVAAVATGASALLI